MGCWCLPSKRASDKLDTNSLKPTNQTNSRGLSYERVLVNILKVYSDAGNLLLVINCADWEEQYYKSKLDAKYVHEVANTATER